MITQHEDIRSEHQLKGLWISAEILECDKLTPSEKLLYAMINSLEQECPQDGCGASNKLLAQKLKISDKTLERSLKTLYDLFLIVNVGFNGRQRYLRINKNTDLQAIK